LATISDFNNQNFLTLEDKQLNTSMKKKSASKATLSVTSKKEESSFQSPSNDPPNTRLQGSRRKGK